MEGISLRPAPFLAHWAPGAILTLGALFYVADRNGIRLFWKISSHLSTTSFILSFALISFAVGQVLDAIRDGIFEDVFDKIGSLLPKKGLLTALLNWMGMREVNWRFFVTGEQRTVENLEIWFYSHYMLTFNFGFGLLLLLLPPWWKALPDAAPIVSHALKTWLTVAAFVLLYDALRLRSHVADISVNNTSSR